MQVIWDAEEFDAGGMTVCTGPINSVCIGFYWDSGYATAR